VHDEVMPTISSRAEAQLFSKTAVKLRKTARVHVKIDTGMGRLGVIPAEAKALIRLVNTLPGLRLAGVYTHYASAEEDAEFCRQQHFRFLQAMSAAISLGKLAPFRPDQLEYLHVNNSAAILFESASTHNTVRPGLLVYGVAPSTQRPLPPLLKKHLRPALTWKTRISLLKPVPARTPLSYGQSYSTAKPTRIATITAGYGDGYMRAGSNRARVLIHGRLCPVVGRITMDQMLVNVTGVKNCAIGDEVVLIGAQGPEQITANEVAGWCGTVPWEILTNISHRVPRLYLGSHAS
jgi:alanine racemase